MSTNKVKNPLKVIVSLLIDDDISIEDIFVMHQDSIGNNLSLNIKFQQLILKNS